MHAKETQTHSGMFGIIKEKSVEIVAEFKGSSAFLHAELLRMKEDIIINFIFHPSLA